MTRGAPTPDAKVLEFRAHYLELGNARAAARATGIPESTGAYLAREAEADPAFVQERADIASRVLPELERMVLSAARSVHSRVLADDRTPEELAEIAVANNLKSFSYQNPKPQYFRGLVDAFKGIAASRKIDVEKHSRPTGGVTIHVHPTADAAARLAEESDDGSPSGES